MIVKFAKVLNKEIMATLFVILFDIKQLQTLPLSIIYFTALIHFHSFFLDINKLFQMNERKSAVSKTILPKQVFHFKSERRLIFGLFDCQLIGNS